MVKAASQTLQTFHDFKQKDFVYFDIYIYRIHLTGFLKSKSVKDFPITDNKGF